MHSLTATLPPSLAAEADSHLLSFVQDYLQDHLHLLDPHVWFEFLHPLFLVSRTTTTTTTNENEENPLFHWLHQLATTTAATPSPTPSSSLPSVGARKLKAMVRMQDQLKTESQPSEQQVDVTLSRVRATVSLAERQRMEKGEERKRVKQRRKLKDQLESRQFVKSSFNRNEDGLDSDGEDPLFTVGESVLPQDVRLEGGDGLHVAGRCLLSSDVQVTLAAGRRYGLIGRNGVGKSTLLKAIVKRHWASLKATTRPVRMLYVSQELKGDDTPVLERLLQSDPQRDRLLKREREILKLMSKGESHDSENLKTRLFLDPGSKTQRLEEEPSDTTPPATDLNDELASIYAQLATMDADGAVARASTLLKGLGFSDTDHHRPSREFSGGWRMRMALARALFCRPDVLLLDEPTNHCDLQAVVWLESYLQAWPGTVVVVSHDRDFLDETVTDILHMHNERIDHYRGNYSQFIQTRLERRRNQLKEYEAQLQYRQHIQAFIDRWRFNAKRAAQAQSKIKILEKLPPLQPPEDDGVDDEEGYFKWPDPSDKLASPLLQADDVCFAYPQGSRAEEDDGDVPLPHSQPSRMILKNVRFRVDLGARIGIVGANGSGKTTLLRLLLGQLNPTQGFIQRNPRLRIAYFSQHHVDALEAEQSQEVQSAFSFLQSKFPGWPEEGYRTTLGRFGLTGSTALQPLHTLSGGQKSRVVFAMMALSCPHVLVLDEVTNHLDIMTVESLVKALHPKRGFQGAMVLVSHDARFLQSVCQELWVCEKGQITPFVSQRTMLAGDDEDEIGNCGVQEYKEALLRKVS